ncbi:M23 family metallopeptidase [Kribbella italica]
MTPLLLAPFALPLLAPITPPVPLPLTSPPADASWPLDPRPRIVHPYAPPAKPWLPGHRGIDLAGTPGQPVLSATSGTITYAGPVAGRSVVVVTHGQLRTTYEPVIPTLPTGTSVQTAQPLGHLSAAASHCAPTTCLHWGLLEGRTYLNPLDLLPTQPVRLLPTNAPHAPTPFSAPAPTAPPSTAPSPSLPAPRPQPQPTSPPASPQPQPSTRVASPTARHQTPSPLPTVVVTLSALATLGATLLVRNH